MEGLVKMKQIYRISAPNSKWIVIHTEKRTYGFLVQDFGEALELFTELGMEASDITHVDVSNMKVDGVQLPGTI